MRRETHTTQRWQLVRNSRLHRGSQVQFYVIYLPSLVFFVAMGLAAAEFL